MLGRDCLGLVKGGGNEGMVGKEVDSSRQASALVKTDPSLLVKINPPLDLESSSQRSLRRQDRSVRRQEASLGGVADGALARREA